MSQMLTVAICTWNRAEMLRKTLKSITSARRPTGSDWELLVVNNNCTDHTDAVIEEFSGLLPIKRIWQPTPGLSNARNAAIEHATGSYIIWTDDDVLVDREWITAYEAAFQRHPEAAFFGGVIEPWFENSAPPWMMQAWPAIRSAFAAKDLGPEEMELRGPQFPFGASYAVRADAQKLFPYRTDLGRRPGGTWLAGEEMQLFWDLIAKGLTGWWIPSARVQHWIPPDRQSIAYVKKYFEGLGRTDAVQDPVGGRMRLAGVPAWLWVAWFKFQVRYALLRTFSTPDRWGGALTDAYRAKGRLLAGMSISG